MYVNNIAENRSTRVLQRPGGQQSFNIFGGDDHAAAAPAAAARGGAPAAAAPAAAPVEQLKPTYSMHSSSDIFGTKPASSAAPSSAAAPRVNNIWGSDGPATSASASSASTSSPSPPAAAAAAAPVNNIWGTNDSGNKPSTRVLNRPGGGSAGVAGILGGADADAPVNQRANAARINAVSADSPFATSAQSQQPQRRQGGGATRGSGNILSWE